MDIDEPDRLAVAGCNVEEPLKLQASPWSKGCAPAVPSRSASFALNTHPIPELPGRATTTKSTPLGRVRSLSSVGGVETFDVRNSGLTSASVGITKKPRRSSSASGSNERGLYDRGTVSMPVTPTLGPHAPPTSPMLTGLSAVASPTTGGVSCNPLLTLEPDVQPQGLLRSHEFKAGRRVFHVHFGHGFVKSIEAEPSGNLVDHVSVLTDRVSPPLLLPPRTHNINVVFDHPKYNGLPQRLRAYFALPKMVVIPSATALRKHKLLNACDVTPSSEAQRVLLVRSLLTSGSIRAACVLISRWKLSSQFDPRVLIDQLVATKCFSAAVRFAREFGLTRLRASSDGYCAANLYRKMLEEKHYEGPLKHLGATQTTVDGEHTPYDLLQLLVGAGRYAVALKYVHKFGAAEQFPPHQLVSSCWQAESEWTVRTCGLLLKYIKIFDLEHAFPMKSVIKRVEASGVTVHEVDGSYVLKGRRRRAISTPDAASSSQGSRAGSLGT